MRGKVAVFLVLGILLTGIFPIQNVFSTASISSTPSNSENSVLDFIPTMHIAPNIDNNHNGIADDLDQEIAIQSVNIPQQYVDVIVMLKTPPTGSVTNLFVSQGGYLTTTPWTYALYGFGGRILYNEIASFVEQCPNVLLVEKDAIGNGNLAYATKQVGARTYVWNNLALKGDPNSAIAVIDSGIDASHPDFAPGYGDQNFQKKIVGWNDQVTSTTSPVDDHGHGSHTAGIAAGDGFFSTDSSGNAIATWGANLGGISSGNWQITGMMVNKTGNINLSVKWSSTGTARLNAIPLYYGDKTITGSWSQVANVNTNNPNTWYSLTYTVASTPAGGYDMYHPEVNVTSGTGNLYIAFNMSWPYTPPADGFSAWTGMAPQSKLVGVKVLNSAGSCTNAQFISGVNWVIANRATYHITVASISIGWSAEQSSVDSAVVNLVNSGVATVISAGNSGPGSNYIFTPGSVDEVTTVAAMNQFDGVTSFSSQGGASYSTGNTIKPDITAPGGSFYGVPMFSADSNTNDAEGGFNEIQVNDSAPMQGTSMAAPMVAGAEQLIVQAMGGYAVWNWTRSQALFPKTMVLMTATETYPNLREAYSASSSPTLDRGGKDIHEGYGRLNVDAAADAVLKSYQIGSTASDVLGNPPKLTNIAVLGQRLAWARNVQLTAGTQYIFSLSVQSGADYDLYLYNITGNTYGEPVIVSESASATTGGFENIAYTPYLSGQYYIVVKLAREDSGAGSFNLTSSALTDWPMFRHDLIHSGYSLSKAVNTNNTLWSEKTGIDIYSSPAVANGKLYVGVNTANNQVYCLNASNGVIIWTYTTNSTFYSSPAVDNNKVYIGTYDGYVYCLNATNGALVWRYKTGGSVYSSPTIDRGKLYVGSLDDKVYCLNADTGGLLWSYTTGGEIVYSSAAVAYGMVYIGSEDGKVYALDAITGAPIWTYTTGNWVWSSPTVAYGLVYTGSRDNKVYALNATSGSLVWSYSTGNYVDSSPAVANGRVYVGSLDDKLYCLDAMTGSPKWSFPTGNTIRSSPAIAEGKVYFGSSDGKIYCLDAITGSAIWNYNTGYEVFSSPAVANGQLYVCSTDSTVYCFGLPTIASLVVRGGDSRIYYRFYDSSAVSWSSWNALPTGTTIDSPAAVVCSEKLYVIVRGSDGSSLWFSSLNMTDSSFSGWSLLSGSTPSPPTLTSNGTALALVVRGGDNRIYYRFYNIGTLTWTGWSALSSGTTQDTPKASLVANTLHIVVRGSDGSSMWYSNVNANTGTFSGWSLLSGSTPSTPTLTSNGTALSLVVRGGDNHIYYCACNIATWTWTSWSALPTGTTQDTPAATILQNSLIIVVRGSDGTSLWTSNLNLSTSAFSGWALLSGSTPSKPILTS